MARPASLIPKYRRHKGTGQAFVQIKGHRHYLGKWGTPASKAAYTRFVANLARDSDPGESAAEPQPVPSPGSILVCEVLAGYWQYAEGYYQKNGVPSGWLRHIKLVLGIVRRRFGNQPACDLGPLALKSIQAELVEAGHSRNYVNKLVAIVPRMFKWAASEQLVPGRVYHDLRTVEGLRKGRTKAPDHPPVPPVADTVVDATLPHLPAVVGDMVRLQRATGMRPGEVCQLRPMDLDRSTDVWLYRPASHKTEHLGRERVICVGPRGQDVLRAYLLRPADSYCFSPAESEAKRRAEMRTRRKSKVQPSQRNRRKPAPKRPPAIQYTKDSYARAIRRAIRKANRAIQGEADRAGIENPQSVPFWAPNQLRHSKATEVRKLFGLEAAQVTLGHANARITEVYAERDTRLAADIARKIG